MEITLQSEYPVVIEMGQDNKVLSISLRGEKVEEPYHEYGLMVGRADTPGMTIWELTAPELEEIALNGGKISVFADDLYQFKIYPSWWGVEFDMAMEGDTPPWPLSEEAMGGEDTSGWGIISALMAALNPQDPEDPEEWDEV